MSGGHRRGLKILHHAEVGELHLRYEALEVSGQPGVRLFGYTPDPDHPATSTALKLLASLAGPAEAPTPGDYVGQSSAVL